MAVCRDSISGGSDLLDPNLMSLFSTHAAAQAKNIAITTNLKVFIGVSKA